MCIEGVFEVIDEELVIISDVPDKPSSSAVFKPSRITRPRRISFPVVSIFDLFMVPIAPSGPFMALPERPNVTDPNLGGESSILAA